MREILWLFVKADFVKHMDLNGNINKMEDKITPKYYRNSKIECIDAIESATINKKGLDAVCTANIIKYVWRCEEKNGLEDMKKALWYLEKMIKHHEETESAIFVRTSKPLESFSHPSAVKPIADISYWGGKL